MLIEGCPFCGATGKLIHPMNSWVSKEVGYGPDGSRIVCPNSDCSCAGLAFYGPDQDANAIAWWNTRSTPPASSNEAALVDELAASLEELLVPLERASAEMLAKGGVLNEAGEAAFDRARSRLARHREGRGGE